MLPCKTVKKFPPNTTNIYKTYFLSVESTEPTQFAGVFLGIFGIIFIIILLALLWLRKYNDRKIILEQKMFKLNQEMKSRCEESIHNKQSIAASQKVVGVDAYLRQHPSLIHNPVVINDI